MNDDRCPCPARLLMVSDHTGPLPATSLPPGYRFTPLVGDGGLASWLEIWREAHPSIKVDEDRFRRAFGQDADLIAQRITLLVAPGCTPVGTVAAWFGDEPFGESIGRLHWLAVRPSAQRHGLGTALLGHAVRNLRASYTQSYLVTQSDRIGAIRLYLKFGYTPHMPDPCAQNSWRRTLANLQTL